jgi:hypothetical protein
MAYVETGHQPYDVGGRGSHSPAARVRSFRRIRRTVRTGSPLIPVDRFWTALRLPQSSDASWLGLSPSEAAPLVDMLWMPANLCAKWPADFPRRFSTLFELFDRPASAVRTAMLRTSLLTILFDLLDLNTPDAPLAYRARIKKATDWADTHLTESVTSSGLPQRGTFRIQFQTRLY